MKKFMIFALAALFICSTLGLEAHPGKPHAKRPHAKHCPKDKKCKPHKGPHKGRAHKPVPNNQ